MYRCVFVCFCVWDPGIYSKLCAQQLSSVMNESSRWEGLMDSNAHSLLANGLSCTKNSSSLVSSLGAHTQSLIHAACLYCSQPVRISAAKWGRTGTSGEVPWRGFFPWRGTPKMVETRWLSRPAEMEEAEKQRTKKRNFIVIYTIVALKSKKKNHNFTD